MHACMHTYIHTYMHACMHAYVHTYIRTYIHTCMHAYVHTYIHTMNRCNEHTHIYILLHICNEYASTYVLYEEITVDDECPLCTRYPWQPLQVVEMEAATRHMEVFQGMHEEAGTCLRQDVGWAKNPRCHVGPNGWAIHIKDSPHYKKTGAAASSSSQLRCKL